MARKIPSKRVVHSVSTGNGSPSRDLVLAGIGAVSLGRKQAIASYQNFGQNAAEFGERITGAIESIESRARKLRKQTEGKVSKLRQQAQARIVPIRKKLLAVVGEAKAQAETRLEPVLGRFGIKAAPKKRAVRKQAPSRKAVARRTRKVA